MARKPRIHYPGALYHLIVKGNAGNPIFFDDVDRCRFCFLLQEGIERFGHRIHAFSLLSNHVHMAIQVRDIPLSRIVQNFSFRHSQWINRRTEQSGHVFQGRYKARNVDGDTYLRELVRYIDLNPVKAGIALTPDDHFWGSHRSYAGNTHIPWLTTDWVLSLYGDDANTARIRYKKFVYEGMRNEPESEVFDMGYGRFLGDDEFIEEASRKAHEVRLSPVHVDDVITCVCEMYELTVDLISSGGGNRRLSEARAMAAWGVRELSEETLISLSKRVNRDVSTLSAAATKIAGKAESDVNTRKKMEELKSLIRKSQNTKA